MSEEKMYKEYFAIDPKYYAAVTAELIRKGEVRWNAYYPHETFVRLLEKTHDMLSGKDSRSLWVQGAYGSGKSHAALTVKSLLEAGDDEIRAYFKENDLSDDLCQKLITDKNGGKLITIHRIGSASIRSDDDLILAIQDSVTAALKEHGIQNRGEASLKDAALKWFNARPANRTWFNELIHDDEYQWEFGGRQIDEIISTLETGDDETVSKLMPSILRVARDNGITALRMDIPAMCEWIKSVIANNDISAVLFVWDEFTEYFEHNANAVTGFQTIVELSQAVPFYFLIVTHEVGSYFSNPATLNKLLNRFVGDKAIRIDIPENMAMRLMAKALKTTTDPVLLQQWNNYKDDINNSIDLRNARAAIFQSIKNDERNYGSKIRLSDDDLKSVFPLHPYAAIMLKNMSVVFSSNARSMFDFIISNDTTEAKGFKWFIENYGPTTPDHLLTIDMLWDYFTAKEQKLSGKVRTILDSYHLVRKGALQPESERVFKTVLLLEAVSQVVSNVSLLRPTSQNIDLAFTETGWQKGKAMAIAKGLFEQGILFERSVGNGLKEYTVANSGAGGADIAKLKNEIRSNLKTTDLISVADLLSAVALPASIHERYILEGAAHSNFPQVLSRANGNVRRNRFTTIVAFSMTDEESTAVRSSVLKAVTEPDNELFFIESLIPMGKDLIDQYVENMAFSQSYGQSDKQRALGFEEKARNNLKAWKQNIASGAFMLYTPENKNGFRAANLEALKEELLRIDRQKYFCGPEQYSLIDNMFMKGPLAQGAECGIKQELRQTFNTNRLSAALEGAWQTDRYWEDSAKKSLSIVRIKQRVIELVNEGFEKGAGRVSVLSLFEALEDAPYGFMPNNVCAFLMGFVLKEYATSDYFWSNGSNSEVMNVDKMKTMIANALNQRAAQSSKYKEEYIVAMSPEIRCFLNCTSAAFHIPAANCGSVESARDQIRIKMKALTFPIWCVKSILGTVKLDSSADDIAEVIEAYCGIANTANYSKETESSLAEQIGRLVKSAPAITSDLERLLTNEMCRNGMIAYIDEFDGGVLRKLAEETGDNGAYIDRVKQKFSADAANWVWSRETADERIKDVILEYRIIAESNKSLPKCMSVRDVVLEWGKRTNNICMPFDVLKKHAGDMTEFLRQLYYIKQSGQLQEQYKQQFYDELSARREDFDRFYKDQLPMFRKAASSFISELSDQEIAEFRSDIPSGQFTKSSTEYYQFIEKEVEDFRKKQKKSRLSDLWRSRTGTRDPADWSARYETPILCMFSDAERPDARAAFSVMTAFSAPDADIIKAIEYLENADFYDRLADPAERDRCFRERVIGEYGVMLDDVDAVRRELSAGVMEKPYNWLDNSAVKNRLRALADKKYKTTGYQRAQSVIDQLDPAELRRYLSDLISDNLTVGMEILKNDSNK